jgi:hypothetical protein
MPPKFQSSFIPKGPLASGGVSTPLNRVNRRDLVTVLAQWSFGISVILALAVTGYKFYLDYSIKSMGAELEATRQALSDGAVDELIRLNDRIVSTQTLLQNHKIISPVFDFLETFTPRTVRLTEFQYTTNEKGPEVSLRGEAQGYAALALYSDLVNKNEDFRDPVFSDIRLDDRGNVTFLLKTMVAPELLSYQRAVVRAGAAQTTPVTQTATSTVATTTAATATSTAARTATTTPARSGTTTPVRTPQN